MSKEIKCPICGNSGISKDPSHEIEGAVFYTCYRCKIDFWVRVRTR